MTYKYATFSKWITVLVDYFLLNLALYASFAIESNGSSFWGEASESYRFTACLLNLLWFYCASMFDLYNNILVREAIPTIKATIVALLLYLTVSHVLVFAFPQLGLSNDFINGSLIIFFLLILFGKIIFLSIRKSRREFWIEYKKIIIVGAGPIGMELCKHIMSSPHLGYKVEGLFDDDHNQELGRNQKLLGGVQDCFNYAVSNGVTEIFCALPANQIEKIKFLMGEADKNMIRFRLVPDLKTVFDNNVMLELYGHMPILTLRKEPLENKANEIIKRFFDILFSLLVITFVLSWLIPVIALLIKLESDGPVFFKQLRSGKGNKPFYCYKFRSMKVNSESDSKQATKGDPRVTRIGAFMRKTSIDELPQFFNVLLGDMSVVGPRPHMLKHTQDYALLISNFMVRHFVTPGITGWAQVNGYRGETKETKAMANRVEADLWYLENWTLLLDVKIIFLTIWQIFRRSENVY